MSTSESPVFMQAPAARISAARQLRSGGRSRCWAMGYFVPGRGKVHENTGTEDLRKAERVLVSEPERA